MAKILIVEDEQDLTGPIAEVLARDGHMVEQAGNGADALAWLRVYKCDLIILDWMLPGLSGVEVCKDFRATGGTTPILMLTAKIDVDDKAQGLDAGADDYLTKPFHMKELAARVRALLRRPPAVTGEMLTAQELSLDTRVRKVMKGGREIHLVPKEFQLLEFLLRHRNQLFSADALLDRIWGSGTEDLPETVRTHIKTLRRKIDTPGLPSLIKTVHGAGYGIEGQ